MNLVARLTMALLLAAIFGGAVLALEGSLLYIVNAITGRQFAPRGTGWGLMIIAAMIAGGKIGYRSLDELSLFRVIFDGFLETKEGRLAAFLMTLWSVSWTTYCWFYMKNDPYCYSDCGWNEGDWIYFFSYLVGIPIAILVLNFSIKWIRAGK